MNEAGKRRKVLLPLMLEECEIPRAVGDIHALDFCGWHGSPGDECFLQLKFSIEGLFLERDIAESADWEAESIRGKLELMDRNTVFARAEAGDAGSQYWLGWAFRCGAWGLDNDIDKALAWYSAAAEQDHLSSINQIVELYSEGKEPAFEGATVVKWLEKGAALGDAGCALLAGQAYRYPIPGVRKNLRKARYYLYKARELGNSGDDWSQRTHGSEAQRLIDQLNAETGLDSR